MLELFIIAYYISKMFGKITTGIFSGFAKFLTMERVIVLIVFLILMWALVMYSNNKSYVVDNLEDGSGDKTEKVETGKSVDAAVASSGYSSVSTANPADLLPSDANSQWATLNPVNTQDNLSADLLKAGQHIGVDTVGQSLRNANLQLRSDPLIAKADVGPWNQTTIEADYSRVPLELGNGN
jgi:preprotein translocase subunit SecG